MTTTPRLRLTHGLGIPLMVAAAACGKTAKQDGGIPSVDSVPAVLKEAMKLGEATWPGSTVAGVRIAEMVPRGGRSNVYGVHVSFRFDADPTDPTAKSGAVICSPGCTVSRAKVKLVTALPMHDPCDFDAALAAAKRAGLSAPQPIVTSGSWNLDHLPGWRFQANASGPTIKIGEGCAVMP